MLVLRPYLGQLLARSGEARADGPRWKRRVCNRTSSTEYTSLSSTDSTCPMFCRLDAHYLKTGPVLESTAQRHSSLFVALAAAVDPVTRMGIPEGTTTSGPAGLSPACRPLTCTELLRCSQYHSSAIQALAKNPSTSFAVLIPMHLLFTGDTRFVSGAHRAQRIQVGTGSPSAEIERCRRCFVRSTGRLAFSVGHGLSGWTEAVH